jgi:hypothetical protein
MTEDTLGDDRFAATEEASERALAWMSRNTGALAQAIANRQHTEQWIKAVEAMEKSKSATEAAHVQEREARASDAYRDALEAFKEASKEEQKLRYTWQLCLTVIDVWRTKCANERRV